MLKGTCYFETVAATVTVMLKYRSIFMKKKALLVKFTTKLQTLAQIFEND